MSAALQVDPGVYGAASSTLGVLAAGSARSAGGGVVELLAGQCGMAGSDPAGARWAASYDDAAAEAVRGTQDAINACCRLAELLEQTGFNYASADSASGGEPPPVDRTDYAAQQVRLADLPGAAGASGVGPPAAWSLIESVVGRVWPNGHQDRLRSAAAGWHDSACLLYDAGHFVADAVAQLAMHCAPETDAAIDACNLVRDCFDTLADSHKALGQACADYADAIDRAHSEAEHELVSLVEWTAGIEIAGAVTAIITFGGSEVVSQAAVAARVAATAARVAAVIDRLVALAADAAEVIAMVAVRAGRVADSLRPLLQARRVVAVMTEVERARAARAVYAAELDRVAVAASVDLSRVPLAAREEVLGALERARAGKVRFTGHDGKDYENRFGLLPGGRKYKEWTAEPVEFGRKLGDRVIVTGDPANPAAIYYWDHTTSAPIWIGPSR